MSDALEEQRGRQQDELLQAHAAGRSLSTPQERLRLHDAAEASFQEFLRTQILDVHAIKTSDNSSSSGGGGGSAEDSSAAAAAASGASLLEEEDRQLALAALEERKKALLGFL